MNRCGVLGSGSWGTALAMLMAARGAEVLLWGRDPIQSQEINNQRTNRAYLPNATIPVSVRSTTDFQDLRECELLLFVLPSRVTRSVAEQLREAGINPETILLSCTKGIEKDTGLRMTEIIHQVLPANPVAVLSGPNHAEEISQRLAAAAVIGCENETVARRLQEFFTLPWFRTYRSSDVKGIEWGAAVKNVFAIAAGICEGLGLGDNARAALLTRGLAEMIRLGEAEGGRALTFQGLSGVGDLIATCFSHHSRNNRVGRMLGSGQSLAEIAAGMHMVAEGVPNAESIYLTARRHGVRTPIIDQIYAILYEGKPCAAALTELLSRDPRAEHE
jgi:glycerol-3-phosphate dehydrogenase (NAD(P)+)